MLSAIGNNYSQQKQQMAFGRIKYKNLESKEIALLKQEIETPGFKELFKYINDKYHITFKKNPSLIPNVTTFTAVIRKEVIRENGKFGTPHLIKTLPTVDSAGNLITVSDAREFLGKTITKIIGITENNSKSK